MKKFVVFSICIVTLFLNAKQVKADLDYGLIAYYPFNGNANDETENGNNGVAVGANLSEDRFTNVNSAYEFDGKEDYIKVPNSALTNFGKGSFTISVWIKANDSILEKNDYHIIDKRKGSGAGKGYDMHLFSNAVRITLQGCNPNLNTSSDKKLNDSNWHHLVAIIDKENELSFVYVDKLKSAQGKTIDCDISNEGDLYIGCRFTKACYFKGLIDDIRIYNRAFSDEEVQELYNSESSGIGTISGRVTTSFAGHDCINVLNAQATLIGTNYSSHTDDQGMFKILSVISGQYTMEIKAPNLETIRKNVIVNFNDSIIIEDIMMPYISYDINSDNKIGLEEAINALRITSGTGG